MAVWKRRAKTAERRIDEALKSLAEADSQAYKFRCQVAVLTRELEDKRKNWAPIKIGHPYVPRDAGCVYCDDPPADPRHG